MDRLLLEKIDLFLRAASVMHDHACLILNIGNEEFRDWEKLSAAEKKLIDPPTAFCDRVYKYGTREWAHLYLNAYLAHIKPLKGFYAGTDPRKHLLQSFVTESDLTALHAAGELKTEFDRHDIFRSIDGLSKALCLYQPIDKIDADHCNAISRAIANWKSSVSNVLKAADELNDYLSHPLVQDRLRYSMQQRR